MRTSTLFSTTILATAGLLACLANTAPLRAQSLQQSTAFPSHVAESDSSDYSFGMVAIGTSLYVSRQHDTFNLDRLDWSNADGTARLTTQGLSSMPTRGTRGPALAVYNNDIYMVFREDDSSGSDRKYLFTKYSVAAGTWSQAQNIRDMSGGSGSGDDEDNVAPGTGRGESDHSPALALAGSTLFVLDKNNTKHFLAECWYDFATQQWASNTNDTDYAPSKSSAKSDREDDDRGYLDTYTDNNGDSYIRNQIRTSPGKWVPQTPRTPSAAVFPDNQLHVAYKGGRYADDSDAKKLYELAGNVTQHTWSDPVEINGFQSKFGPAITTHGGTPLLVFSDASQDHRLCWSKKVGNTWTAAALIFKNADHDHDVPHDKGSPVITSFAAAGHVALSYVRKSDEKAVVYLLDYK